MILVRFLNALRRWVVSRGLAKIPPGPGLSRPYKFCSTSLRRKRARTSCDTLENIESAGGCSLMSNVLFLDAIASPNTYPWGDLLRSVPNIKTDVKINLQEYNDHSG